MKEYLTAPVEVHEFVDNVRAQYHEEIGGYDLGIYFVDTLGENMGRPVAAKIKKASGFEKHVTEHDLILFIDEHTWTGSHNKVAYKTALIDHELSHVGIETTDKGEKRLRIVGHEIEDFRAVIERHGDWANEWPKNYADLIADAPQPSEANE